MRLLMQLVGRLAVVRGSEDIFHVIDKLNVPHPTKRGVDAVIVDLDPKVPKLMDYLKTRALSPVLGKLPVVAVVVVIDPADPRPELLAQALESGVDAVLLRPLDVKVVAACLGEVLRKHACIEAVYKDLVGEVETFNYPRFIMDVFHFLGVGDAGSNPNPSSEDDHSEDLTLGEAVQMYTPNTVQTSPDGLAQGSLDTASNGWVQACPGGRQGRERYSSILSTAPTIPHEASVSAGDSASSMGICGGANSSGATSSWGGGGGGGGGGGWGSSIASQKMIRAFGKVRVMHMTYGGHVKVTSTSQRPMLYTLTPADKEKKEGSAEGSMGKREGIHRSRKGGPSGARAIGVDGQAQKGGDDGGTSDTEDDPGLTEGSLSHALQMQVSPQMLPFVRRRMPPPLSPRTSAGLSKSRLACTMKLVEATFAFTQGQSAEVGWQVAGRKGSPPTREVGQERSAAVVGNRANLSLKGTSQGTAGKDDCSRTSWSRGGGSSEGGSHKSPNVNILNKQKRITFRQHQSPGIVEKVTRLHKDPTDTASTTMLSHALGFGGPTSSVPSFIADKVRERVVEVRSRCVEFEGLRQGDPLTQSEKTSADKGGLSGSLCDRPSPNQGPDVGHSAVSGVSPKDMPADGVGHGLERGRVTGREGVGAGTKRRKGVMRGAHLAKPDRKGARQEREKTWRRKAEGKGKEKGEGGNTSIFRTVLSQIAKRNLKEGLKEIATHPQDLLRHGYQEIEPSRQGSTAAGCHMISGWEQQKVGNVRKALYHYRKAVQSDPENILGLLCKAVVGARLGEFFDALKDLTNAIYHYKKRPQKVVGGGGEDPLGPLYFNRAIVNTALGDDESALQDLDAAIAIDTRNTMYRSNRALILRRLGDFHQAHQDYSRVWLIKVVSSTLSITLPITLP
ncbi:unnamed protein product [Discosporangium mesarthrocarpum]